MKKILLLLVIILCYFNTNAQSFNLEFDHYTILVRDLDKSGEFYKNILQFKEKETLGGTICHYPYFFWILAIIKSFTLQKTQ